MVLVSNSRNPQTRAISRNMDEMEPSKFFGNAADEVMHTYVYTSKAAVNATAAQAKCGSLAGSKQEVGKATFAGWLPWLLRINGTLY